MPETSDTHVEQIFPIPNVAQRPAFTDEETRSNKGHNLLEVNHQSTEGQR